MKRWKKNLMKVPIEILEKIKRIESQDIIVACAKRIPLSNCLRRRKMSVS